MRYGIFADVHANLEALEAVLNACKKEDIDKYLCVGDVVGYAANPNECVKIVKSLAMITVAGNHDWASVNLFALNYFNPVAEEAVIWARENIDDESKIFLGSLKLVFENEGLVAVHGTLNNPQEFDYMRDSYIALETFGLMQRDICFVGHTHVAGIFIKDRNERIAYQQDESIKIKEANKYIINVGSVGQPRDGKPAAAYCIYDTAQKEVEIKRINYDIETTRMKIIDAGLPKFLGDRLLTGK